MTREFTAVIEKKGRWYVAWVEEIPGVNTQGKTLAEARRNLKEALQLILEQNRLLSKSSAGARREVVSVEVRKRSMKRRDLLRHLAASGCILIRKSSRHSVLHNPREGLTSTVPRHSEINDYPARKICRDPRIPPPE